MKLRSILGAVSLVCLLLLPSVLPAAQLPAQAQDPDWEEVAPGIHYRLYELPTPNRVYVARMDRSALDVTLDTSIAMGRLASGRETVLNMARRYDGALNAWGETSLGDNGEMQREPGWGTRSRVAVAINGFYFNPTTGYPIQGVVHSGWYARRFDDCESGTGGSGFAWGLDRSAFIGESVRHYVSTYTYDSSNTLIGEQRFPQQFITRPPLVNRPAAQVTLDGLNRSRGDGEVILYTPQYDWQTYTPITGTEMLVELSGPAMIDPTPVVVPITTTVGNKTIRTETVSGFQQTITGTVKSVLHSGASLIPFDHVVISAGSSVSNTLTQNFLVGDEINISQTILACGDAPAYPWGNTYTSIGGAFYFLRNNEIYDFSHRGEANVRDPRTAVAFNDQYIFFIVVDGRDPYWSVGMSIRQLALFARDTLKATYGIAEDGGGSSTMVINGAVVNNPMCNNGLCRSKAFLPMVVNPGGFANATSSGSDLLEAAALADPYARLVANGLMMVVVEPAVRSQQFSPGVTLVNTTTNSNVRLGPGLNYTAFTSVPMGAKGVVIDHPGGLNGIYAKGSYWWKVWFYDIGVDGDVVSGPEGWVSESLLQSSSAP